MCRYYLNQDWTSSSHKRGPRPARGPHMCIHTHIANKEWFTACCLSGDDLHFPYNIYANKVAILCSAGHIMFSELYYWSYSGDRIGTETAQSIQRLAIGLKVGGSNPGAGEIFRTCPERLWGPPQPPIRVFPGSRAAGAWHWTSTLPSADIKESVELYLYSPSGPSWPVLG